MRNRIIILLLAMFSLTACVYDQYKPEYCTDEPIYLSFVLRGTGAPLLAEETKAATTETSWSAQDVAEQLVSRVDLYFYTGGGQYLGKHRQDSFTQNWDGSKQNVSNEVGKFAVRLDYKPYRMLVTVNSSVDLSGKTLQEAREVFQGSGEYQSKDKVDNIKYNDGTSEVTNVYPFYMSSSTYLNANKREICDVLIPTARLKETEAEALKVPIPVYLERLAAKINLIVPKKEFEVPIVTSQDTVTAKVELKGWALNAINRSSYFFKKVDNSWDYSFNQGTSPSIYWNNAGKYRSYWSMDCNYTAADHPLRLIAQKTDVPTDPTDPEYEAFVYRKPAALTEGWTWDADKNAYVGTAYCLENTSGADVLPVVDNDASSTLYSRATHIIIKAQLSFGEGYVDADGDGNNDVVVDDDNFGTSPQTVFRYNGMFYTASGLLKALRRDTKDYGNPLDGIPDSDLMFISAHDRSSYCKGYDKGERVAVYRISTGSYPDVKEASGEPVRIDGFKDGYFYYKIPIEHINNEDAPATGFYPMAKYAVVRNHNYQITIGDLKGIGTGIYNENYDIRPFRKTDDYRVTAYVKVSPWTQFETRFLFVDPSGLLVTDGQKVIQWEDEGDPAKDGKGDNVWTGNGWYF